MPVKHKAFGERVRARCEKFGFGIPDLRSALKVKYEMARRYYLGISMPSAEVMLRLAQWLSCDVAWLQHGKGTPDTNANWQDVAQSRQEFSDDARQVAIAFSRLSPAQRAYYRESIFRDAAIASTMPWFKTGKPNSEGYEDFEDRVERDFNARVKQLKLAL